MFRKSSFIISAAVVLYAVALGVAWEVESSHAERRAEEILKAADDGFAAVVHGEIDAALRYIGGALVNQLGTCGPLPVERMRELARTFNVDEVNIVNRRGIAIASNIPLVIGFNFATNPLTAEFLSLTNELATGVAQAFRPGVANPDLVCKYYGIPFLDRSGFIQVGMSPERLRQNMYSYSEEEALAILRDWHFSVVGWYERATIKDCDIGRIFHDWSDYAGKKVIGRYFSFEGFQYAALIPEEFCYAQRNASFFVTALVLSVLVSLFALILLRLAKASVKMEALHMAARARTAGDMALARKIQMSALPRAEGAFLEQFAFSFRASSTPAREVGGDFYDFYPLPDGRIAFLVADVAGKGIPGAMFMMEAKNVLKNRLTASADIAEAVERANQEICANNTAELFVTAWIGALDPATGVFEYVNAGHNRPFIRRADGSFVKVQGKGGRFLGLFGDATYRANVLRLNPGDVLFLYTDGITEAMNAKGELFGERRVIAALTGYENRLPAVLADFVGAAEQSDDMTSIILRWNGSAALATETFAANDGSLGPAVDFIRRALAGVDAKTLAAVLNAADEVMSNIVNYSGSPDFTVAVERAYDRVRLVFSDAGSAYNPLSHADPDTHATIEERPVGGLGLVMVKRLVDRVVYAREGNRNILTIIRSCSSIRG